MITDPRATSPRPFPESPKILVVDDEKAFTDKLSENLSTYTDYQVVTLNDPQSAHQTALEILPDVVILDTVMPGMDGLTVLEQLQSDEVTRDIPVIFITALSDMIDFPQPELDEIGERRTLAKPVDLAQLIIAIENEINPSVLLS